MLYDDSEKLLDSRLMKKDEMVKSGETLTFDAFLVDVGDPEGDHRPLSDLNMQGSNKYYVQKSGSLPGEECRSNPVSAGTSSLSSNLFFCFTPCFTLSKSQRL